MAENSNEGSYIQLTANIVSAYVSNNSVSSAEIPALISQVYSALLRISNGSHVATPTEPLTSTILAEEAAFMVKFPLSIRVAPLT